MQRCELVFSLLVDPSLEPADLALLQVVLAEEVVLPSVLENDLEAIRLVSVCSISQKTEFLRVAHVHQIKWCLLELQVVNKTLMVLIGDVGKHSESLSTFNVHAWLHVPRTRLKAIAQMGNVHHR
jgi:hypothetical protein